MKSILNVFVIFALLLVTVSCGLAERFQSSSDSDNANTESNESGDINKQDGFESSESQEDESESALETDKKKVEGNKSVTVRFGKGKTSRAYRNTVAGGFKHTYTLGASAGQKMNVKISSGDGKAYFKVFDYIGKRMSKSEVGDKSFSEEIPEKGNYKIEVMTPGDQSTYTVNFSVSALPKKEEGTRPPGGGGLTRTVKFAKGRTSASYSGGVIRGEEDIFILGAKAGQLMSVSITSPENNAVFQVKGPNGYLRGVGPGTDKRSWSGQLPANGKYRVEVGGTRGNASYKITFAIK